MSDNEAAALTLAMKVASPVIPPKAANIATTTHTRSYLQSLRLHSVLLAAHTNNITLLCSFLYLLFNYVKNYYHYIKHFKELLFIADFALFVLNCGMMVAAVSYWVSFTQRHRAEIADANHSLSSSVRNGDDGDDSGSDNDNDSIANDDAPMMETDMLITSDLPLSALPLSQSQSSLSPPTLLSQSPSLLKLLPYRLFPVPLTFLFQSLSSTLLTSPYHYLTTIDGVAELLNLIGSSLFVLSSVLPLMLSTHRLLLSDINNVSENVEATVDELGYVVDGVAMLIYMIGAAMYCIIWKREHDGHTDADTDTVTNTGNPMSCSLILTSTGSIQCKWWFDASFWSNVWNIAAGICYAFSIFYGLSIRIHLAQKEHLDWGMESDEGDVSASATTSATSNISLNTITTGESFISNSSMIGAIVSNVTQMLTNSSSLAFGSLVAADDLSDLSVWQRALYGLTEQQKLMMTLGDALYTICACCTQWAERQSPAQSAATAKSGSSISPSASHSHSMLSGESASAETVSLIKSTPTIDFALSLPIKS